MLVTPAFVDFDTATEYRSFTSEAEQITTSDLWITKAVFQTPVNLSPGRYIVHHNSDITNDKQYSQTGYRVEYQQDISPGFTVLHESFNGVTKPDLYETRAGFREITITAATTLTFNILFGQTIDGGTAKIKNVGLYLFRVGS